VAAEVMPQFPDGAWFIDLTPIRDAERVVDERRVFSRSPRSPAGPCCRRCARN